MTEIPETKCLKVLCKFSFVTKIRDVTNNLQTFYNKWMSYFDKSYKKPYKSIWLQINSYDFSLKENFLSFGLA